MSREPDFPPPVPKDARNFDPTDARVVFMKIGFLERMQRKIFSTVFSQYDIHPSQGFALAMITHQPGHSQRELADILRLERATITVTLQKLERGGFIRREPDPDDQRVMRIFPTEKGIEAETNISEEIQRFHKVCFNALTAEENQQLTSLLQKLEDTVVDYQQILNREKESY